MKDKIALQDGNVGKSKDNIANAASRVKSIFKSRSKAESASSTSALSDAYISSPLAATVVKSPTNVEVDMPCEEEVLAKFEHFLVCSSLNYAWFAL